MKKPALYLLILCIAAVLGAILLQVFWISNYYQVNKVTFEKQVNLALEDAVKKEFSLRCDTIQEHIFVRLMDTAAFRLTNNFDPQKKTTVFKIVDVNNSKDESYFHTDSIKLQTNEDNFTYRTKLARYFSKAIRVGELEGHYVMYHTQKLGDFVNKETIRYDFDTVRLRPILKKLLVDRGIHVPFIFTLRINDSTYNKTHFDPKALSVYPVITKAFVTFKKSKKDHYVRAMFNNPFPYIASQMGLLFAGSVLLILTVTFSLFYLLRSLYKEKQLSAIKNDFISNITHEFKTPIATVLAAIEAINSFDVIEDNVKTKRYLNHSKNELTRLSLLVDKILNISLYENQQFELKLEQVSIDEVINTILRESSFTSSKIVMYQYFNKSGLSIIQADKIYFHHTLLNVIDNAIKYSEQKVNIKVECNIREGFIVISVQDSGMGIDTAHLPFVFEKFYRVPSKQHFVQGHGLGLSYIKNIIEKHRGWCKLESEPGKGTTVYLAWPI